jgi:hypothetical protein
MNSYLPPRQSHPPSGRRGVRSGGCQPLRWRVGRHDPPPDKYLLYLRYSHWRRMWRMDRSKTYPFREKVSVPDILEVPSSVAPLCPTTFLPLPRSLSLLGFRQDVLETLPQPTGGDRFAPIGFTPRAFLLVQQGLQQIPGGDPFDAFVDEHGADRRQEPDQLVGIFVFERSEGRAPSERRPLPARDLRDGQERPPVIAGPVEQGLWHGRVGKFFKVSSPACELAPKLQEDGAFAVPEMMLKLASEGALEPQNESDPAGSLVRHRYLQRRSERRC